MNKDLLMQIFVLGIVILISFSIILISNIIREQLFVQQIKKGENYAIVWQNEFESYDDCIKLTFMLSQHRFFNSTFTELAYEHYNMVCGDDKK